MADNSGARAFGAKRPPLWLGLTLAGIAVALATAAIYPLKSVAPAVSLSVVYLPAVLLISAYWGLLLGLATSLASAAAFNWFHISPVGRFTISDSRNWVALAAFTIVAATVSTVAELARARAIEAERRRQEADLAAGLARELLAGARTTEVLGEAAQRVAAAMELPSAAIELGSALEQERRVALALRDPDGRQIATLLVSRDLPPDTMDRAAPPRGRLARRAGGDRAAPRRSPGRGRRDRGAAAQRRRQDRAAASRLARPAHAADCDPRRRRTRWAPSRYPKRIGPSSAPPWSTAPPGCRCSSTSCWTCQSFRPAGPTPRPDWVSLEEVVLAAREGLGAGAADVRVTVDPDVPDVRADAAQLERAFANLLENARRYSGGQPVSVQHPAHRLAGAGQGGRPRARDRPVPARADLRAVLPRARAGSEPWTGSGLGLAIAKGFIEANGGTITVESLPGQGTSFVVALPRDRSRARGGRGVNATARPTVLVCDDEHQILRALRVILRDAGFEALPASTAEEALDVAAVSHPDAAIIDLVLPDGDGVELCRRIREWSDDADDRAVGGRRRGRQGQGARGRRRRLRDQAVRPARARRPSEREPAPDPPRAGGDRDHLRRARDRPRAARLSASTARRCT